MRQLGFLKVSQINWSLVSIHVRCAEFYHTSLLCRTMSCYIPAAPKVEWGKLDSPWCLSVCRQGLRNLKKKKKTQKNYWFNSFHTWNVPLWGGSLDPYSFYPGSVSSINLALWWPTTWPRTGFLELFEKNIGSIHVIPDIYPCGASLMTPIHFRVASVHFSPLVAKHLSQNGVSETFWKNYRDCKCIHSSQQSWAF